MVHFIEVGNELFYGATSIAEITEECHCWTFTVALYFQRKMFYLNISANKKKR